MWQIIVTQSIVSSDSSSVGIAAANAISASIIEDADAWGVLRKAEAFATYFIPHSCGHRVTFTPLFVLSDVQQEALNRARKAVVTTREILYGTESDSDSE